MPSALPDDPCPRLCPASRLAPRAVEWLWPGHLPLGKLALLEGDPGLGKSLVALDLCARLSAGRPWPDGSPGPAPAASLVLAAEDDAEDTLRPRLQALGADLDRVLVVRDDPAGDSLRFPSRAGLLDRLLEQTGARLLVIDPITAYLDPGVNVGNDLIVRRALLPLLLLAARRGCVVLLVRHLNKTARFASVYRGLGSIAFLAVCRSAWLIARDPGEPGRRVLAQVKNNLAPPQPALAFEVQAQAAACPTLSWLGPSDLTADQLLGAPMPARADTPRDHAREFLEDFLAAGPRTSREVWAEAQPLGLAERTLRRAMRAAGVRTLRVWGDGHFTSYWLLPGQQLPAAAPDDDTTLEPWLGPLRDKYPAPTPLDAPE
jgi:hypothetical protein